MQNQAKMSASSWEQISLEWNYLNSLVEAWSNISDQEFALIHRKKFFPRHRIQRRLALQLLRKRQREIVETLTQRIEGIPTFVVETKPLWRSLGRAIFGWLIPAKPLAPRLPITAKPHTRTRALLATRKPFPSLAASVAWHASLIYLVMSPAVQEVLWKLDHWQKDELVYYKISEYLPAVFSPEHDTEPPPVKKIIPKERQKIVSAPKKITNEFQMIIQPDAPMIANLPDLNLPNIVSTAPEIPRPKEPPAIAPPLTQPISRLTLPRELLVQTQPVAPPPQTPTPEQKISDITIAPSPIVNLDPKLIVEPNTATPALDEPPKFNLGNTFSKVPEPPKTGDEVPTVAPQIGKLRSVDAPNLIALRINPAPPGTSVNVPKVNTAASFGTESGTGEGGGGGRGIASPGVSIGGPNASSGAAVVQAKTLPPVVAALPPPTPSRTSPSPGTTAPAPLKLPPLSRSPIESAVGTALSPSGESPSKKIPRAEEKKIYTVYLNLANVSSQKGSWILRFSEADSAERDKALIASSLVPSRNADQRGNVISAATGELTAPSVLKSFHPAYPRDAMSERVEGTVILRARIREDGRVEEASVLRSVDPRLDDAALEAFNKWIFKPSQKNGVPVAIDAEISIPFFLKAVF